jgi:hypothetical protein
MTPQQLRARILRLSEDQPLTSAFERAIADRRTRKKDAWYSSQKAHWLGWLKEYDGPGYYGRAEWNVTAEAVYNRIVNPSMVLWLGEAAGVPAPSVKAAADAALRAPDNMSSQSGAIRRHVTWAMIEAALAHRARR